MSFEILPTPTFEKSFKALAKRHRSLKLDFVNFVESLRQNPLQGDEIAPGIRKIRMAITSKGRGKSGGARIITFTVSITQCEGSIFLIDIYDKADYSTVDVHILQRLISEMDLPDTEPAGD